MLKVLQISIHMYPHFGGIEQVTRDIANVLSKFHIEQKIICFNEDAQDGEMVTHRGETVHDTVDGVEVIRCGCFARIVSQPLSISFPGELRWLMDDFQPDVVIFHYPNPYMAQFLLSYRKRNFKLIIFWHLDITKQKILGKLFHGQNLALIQRADKVICTSPIYAEKSTYATYFSDKQFVLPLTVDETRLSVSDEEIQKAEKIRKHYAGNILCFFIGRHVPYKGLDCLIDASARLKNKNIRFLIAGNGALTEELKQRAADDSKIIFLGRLTDSEWRSYLYACDIFCFPSVTRNEAFGLALAEAMYYGKPAVTFTIPGSGVNYVSLDGVTGIECPNRDTEAYAAALCRLADDPALREQMGHHARQRVLEHFTKAQFEKNWRNLFAEL